jgi:NAD+ synthase
METAQLADRLVSWIGEQVASAGCGGAVFGMSGGLDSSVTAALCRRAFPEHCLGVLLPCYSSPEDGEHARLVADRFSIPTRTVVLDGVLDALLAVLPPEEAAGCSPRVKANLKVRLRMITLYYFANRLGYLVVGSSNRSELATGYFTKYGDGEVDIMPLGGLVKGQVRELARFLDVPQPIIDKPPSAGLWPGQTDEEELGFSYEELDRYLLTGEASGDLKKNLEAGAAVSTHKRLPPPVPDVLVRGGLGSGRQQG